MDIFNQIIDSMNTFLYTYILIILLIVVGIYFSIKTNFVQIRLLPQGIRELVKKNENTKGVSSLQALMISTASRVGTGNISGVASAIAIGGAGSVFWMWVLAFIGSASAFIESTLAQIYKVSDKENKEHSIGGPAYYIEQGLGYRNFGMVFSVLIIACFAYGFNALQSYNVSSSIAYYFDEESYSTVSTIIGIILATITACVIFGGVKRIGFITSTIVPIMACLYILLGLFIIIKNIAIIPSVFSNIFQEAFDFQAIFGGFAGSCVMNGIKRGLFSNEAGMGSAPNAAATADIPHPVIQGLVQMLSVFLDTMIICSTTALILLCSGVQGGDELKGMDFVQQAVASQVGEWGIHFITVSIFLFAFTSIIGNYYYSEPNLKFIKDDEKITFIFRISCIVMVFLGAKMEFETVWNLADVLMGLMALVNIVAIVSIGKYAFLALDDYNKKLKTGEKMYFKASDIDVMNTEYWK